MNSEIDKKLEEKLEKQEEPVQPILFTKKKKGLIFAIITFFIILIITISITETFFTDTKKQEEICQNICEKHNTTMKSINKNKCVCDEYPNIPLNIIINKSEVKTK